jgi:hypothetical protein
MNGGIVVESLFVAVDLSEDSVGAGANGELQPALSISEIISCRSVGHISSSSLKLSGQGSLQAEHDKLATLEAKVDGSRVGEDGDEWTLILFSRLGMPGESSWACVSSFESSSRSGAGASKETLVFGFDRTLPLALDRIANLPVLKSRESNIHIRPHNVSLFSTAPE